jgi:hypothetical protein
MKFKTSSLLTALKFTALAVVFILGYQVAGKNYPQATAIVGWVLGFMIGIKFSLRKMSKESE